MAAECPYDFVPVQGLLGATQRDFVAIVRAACLASSKAAPFYYLGVGSRLPVQSQCSGAFASSNSSNAAGRLMRVRPLRTRLVGRPYRSRPAMMIA